MHRVFGLSRDPFAAVSDGDLFWETPVRARARAEACAALSGGTSVWFRGGAGSGRGTVLLRVAGDLAVEGRRVLLRAEGDPPSALVLLGDLLEVCGETSREGDLVDRAGALYARLLEAFRQAGPTLVVPAVAPLGAENLEETRILSELQVAGQPLAPVALAGEGPAPFAGLREVVLPGPEAGEVRAFLAHRATACMCPGLLPAAELDRIAAEAQGLGHALGLARAALARLAFRLPDGLRGELGTTAREGGVLDPGQLREADSLLQALSPKPGVPESF